MYCIREQRSISPPPIPHNPSIPPIPLFEPVHISPATQTILKQAHTTRTQSPAAPPAAAQKYAYGTTLPHHRDGHHMPRSAGVRASRPRAATAGRPTASGCHAGQDVLVCCSLSVQQFNCIILAAYPTCTLPSGVHPVNVSILSSAGHVLREQLPRTDCARVLLLDIARLYPQGRSLHSWRCMAPQYQVYHPPAASHQDQHTAAPEIQPGGGAVQMQTCAVRCAHDHNACCGCSMDGWIGLTVRWQRCGCRGSMNIPGRGAAQPAHTMNQQYHGNFVYAFKNTEPCRIYLGSYMPVTLVRAVRMNLFSKRFDEEKYLISTMGRKGRHSLGRKDADEH